MVTKTKNIATAAKKKKTRFSGIELLRIISMLGIVIYHFGDNIGVYKADFVSYPWRRSALFSGLSGFGRFGVAVFFIITGYFLCKRKSSSGGGIKSKIWPILRVALFYWLLSIILTLIFMPDRFAPSLPLSNDMFTVRLSAIFSYDYWFITAYILLMVLSPYLKKMLDSLTDREVTKICLIIAILSSLVMDVFRLININEAGLNNGGFPIPTPFVYALVGYTIARREKDIKRNRWAVISLLSGVFLILATPFVSAYYASQGWSSHDVFRKELALGTMLSSIGAFIVFSRMKWQNKVVNYIASLTLAVYLVHCNPFTFSVTLTHMNRNLLRGGILGHWGFVKSGVVFLASALGIFAACCIVEIVRRFAVRVFIRAYLVVKR